MSSSEYLSAKFEELAVDSPKDLCEKCNQIFEACEDCGDCSYCENNHRLKQDGGKGGLVESKAPMFIRICRARTFDLEG